MANDFGKVLAALLGGAVLGAAAALLLAPKSGAELRSELMCLAKEKYAKLNSKELSALVDRALEKLRSCCCHCAADVEEAIDEAAREIEVKE